MTTMTTHAHAVPRHRATTRTGRAGAGPVRAWMAHAVRDVGYCAAVLAWSVVAFGVLVAGVTVTASLLVFVVGVVVWLGFTALMRATTWVDRRLAGWQRGVPVRAAYRRPAAPGLLPRIRTATADPQTWRDMGWLALTSIAGFGFGAVALTALGISLAYASMPLWYWAIADPAGQYGLTNLGFATVDTLGEALAVAGAGVLLMPVALLVARGAATAHATLAAQVLGASRDG